MSLCGASPAQCASAVIVTAMLATGCASDPGGQASQSGETPVTAGQLVSEKDSSGHQLRQVPAQQAPSVRLKVSRDSKSGWNLHLVTDNFRFTPEDVGGKVRPGAGHAHLYVDGEKLTRIYSSRFYLSPSAVSKGQHELRVTLNANDHSTWAVDGEPVSATGTITSSGSSGSDGHGHGGGNAHQHQPGSGKSGSTATASASADVVVKASVRDGAVSPPPRRVRIEKGQVVRLVVRSDHKDAVHVHGYDREQPVSPGSPAVLAFTADTTGVFEVETHDPALQLLQLQVR